MRRTRRHADSRISCDGLCLPDRARRSGLLGRHARPGLLGHCLPAPPARAGSPILNEGVRQVRRGLRRIVGTAPRRQARPLGVAKIRRILGAINRETAKGARDASIILLGFASAMRRSELASLTIADVETEPGGLLLAVRRSKTDQDGTGQIVGVAHGQHVLTDPVAALAAWSKFRGTAPGPLFTGMRHRVVTLEPISGDAIARMLRRRARNAGLPPSESPPTRSAPDTPPQPLPPASASTGSPRRPGTGDCPPSSSATSSQPGHCRSPPAATSGSDLANGSAAQCCGAADRGSQGSGRT